MTTINRIEKSDEVLRFIEHSHLFKSFCQNLPEDAQPKDLEIKIKYLPKEPDEKWEKKSTGEVTRTFKGDIRKRVDDEISNEEATRGLVKRTEYYADGSHHTVVYRDRDY